MKFNKMKWQIAAVQTAITYAHALTSSDNLMGTIRSTHSSSEVIVELVNRSEKNISVQTLDSIFDLDSPHCPIHVNDISGKPLLAAKDYVHEPSDRTQTLKRISPGENYIRRIDLFQYLKLESLGSIGQSMSLRLPATIVGIVEDAEFSGHTYMRAPMPIHIMSDPHYLSFPHPISGHDHARNVFGIYPNELNISRLSNELHKRDTDARFGFASDTKCTEKQQRNILKAAQYLPYWAFAGAKVIGCFGKPGNDIPQEQDPLNRFFDRTDPTTVNRVYEIMRAIYDATKPPSQGGGTSTTLITCDTDNTNPKCRAQPTFVPGMITHSNVDIEGRGIPGLIDYILICNRAFWYPRQANACEGDLSLPVSFIGALFHEMVHMVTHSGIGDVTYGAQNCVELRQTDVTSSRTVLNADSYRLFAQLSWLAGWYKDPEDLAALRECSNAVFNNNNG